MHKQRRVNDSVLMFMSELTSRVVAESGIATDRFHLGKIILQSLKDAPDYVLQIDGGTGESETCGSVLERSIRCAVSMRNLGLQRGDVMVLMAPNHIDLTIPFYAAMYLGVIISAVDRTLGVMELQGLFNVNQPRIIFCQSEKAPDIQLALNRLDLDSQIVTFDKGDYLCSFSEFLDKYGDNSSIENFKPSDFDAENEIGLLITTSGTTGVPKAVAATYKNFAISNPYLWSKSFNFPTPTRMAMICSPIQWLTALITFVMSPIIRYTRVLSSKPMTVDHVYHLINTYRPTYTVLSPTFATSLLKPGERNKCDFSCFEIIVLGGSAVPPELIEEIKRTTANAEVLNVYGMSELTCIAFHGDTQPGCCGKPVGCLQCRLINTESQEDIDEPNVPGELWLKGPGIFKEYYNNPKETSEVFTEDRWFKTGDLFYRDENWDFFFLERIKMMLKYKSFQISPVEIENVIRQHPGVLDVAVTGLPDPEAGELPIACIVPHEGHDIDVQEIKDLIKESLSDSKQLRGGVVIMSELPMTPSTKVNRKKLKDMVIQMNRQ